MLPLLRSAHGAGPADLPASSVVVIPARLVRYYEKAPSAAPVGRPSAVRTAMASCPLMQLDTRTASWVLPEQLQRRINVVRTPDCDQPAAPAAGAPLVAFVNVLLDRLMRDGASRRRTMPSTTDQQRSRRPREGKGRREGAGCPGVGVVRTWAGAGLDNGLTRDGLVVGLMRTRMVKGGICEGGLGEGGLWERAAW